MAAILRSIKRKFLSRNGCMKQLISLGILVFMIKLYLLRTDIPFEQRPCEVRRLDPWDPMMMKYMTVPPPFNCPDKHLPLFVDNYGFLQLNASAVAQYSMQNMNCEYQILKTRDVKDYDFDAPVAFKPPTFVEGRVFKVKCYLNSKVVFQYIFTNLVWNESQTREKDILFETDEKPSVIYLGFDSVSRSEALRKLNLSYPYIKNKLGAYDMEGFNKVGLNTFPNLVALFRGKYGGQFAISSVIKSDLDNEYFIWKDAKENGYVTLHMDDSVFTRFTKPPMDYYWKSYHESRYRTEAIIGENLGKATLECYGNKDQFTHQIDYLKRFLTKYKSRRKFVFLWHNELTHDGPGIERGDSSLYQFLVWLQTGGHLDKAVLILGSDHGFRIGGGASHTFVGKLEMNMPVQLIRVPNGLKSRHPWMHDNFLHNTKRLVTHYDMHETLKGIIRSDYYADVLETEETAGFGRKLYTKISPQRSCAEAGIPPNFCTCEDGAKPIDTSLPLVRTMASIATEKINALNKKSGSLCRKLELLDLTDARVSYEAHGNDVIYGPKDFYNWFFVNDVSGRYVISYYTLPNKGLFQTVLDVKTKGENNIVTVLDDPVRMDKYGNQSHCIGDSYMKQFCLCNDVIVT